jgi:uncharacterized protein YfaP (DUF2135 family)
MKKITFFVFLIPLAIAILILGLLDCSEKITNNGNNYQPVSMSLKYSSSEFTPNIVFYIVAISAPDIVPPIVDTLNYLRDFNPYDTVVVPSGRNRKFMLEAFGYGESNEIDRLLYRGMATTDISSGSTVSLTIDMYPVPTCLKFSRRFISVQSESPFTLDIKAFNIKDLRSIIINIPYNLQVIGGSGAFEVDSATKGISLIGNDQFDSGHGETSFFIEINQNNQERIIADANGNATLAKLFLKAHSGGFINPFPLSLEVIEINGELISQDTSSIFVDYCEVYIKQLSISNPIENQIFQSGVITVEGVISDSMVQSATLSLNGHIQQIAIENKIFHQPVVLFAGRNEIIVTGFAPLNQQYADTVIVNCNMFSPALRVQLNWDKDSTDVDLWVTEPDGTPVYHNNRQSSNGGVLDIDDLDGFGPENYSIMQPPNGIYSIKAVYHNDYGFGPSIAEFKIFKSDNLIYHFEDTLYFVSDTTRAYKIQMPEGTVILQEK